MRSPLVCWAAVLTTLACANAPEPPRPDDALLRSLPAGRVVGHVSADGAHAWRGIPFAEPPVGALRWRAPRPAAPWAGTLEATRETPACVQFPLVVLGGDDDEPVGSEDCLTLNVFAPPLEASDVAAGRARLPVMVWIHGGANLRGEKATYDWSRFAVAHDTIVVTLSYRLGVLGWFRHEALWSDEDDAFDRSGNFGTLDLIRGLAWVRDNVAGFGGDPDNVTVFGESAGGNNVLALLLSPPAEGLFHRAIVQSGGQWSSTRAEAENWADAPEPGRKFSSRELLARLLIADGRAGDRSAARALAERMPPAETGAFLRGRTPEQLMAALGNGPDVTMSTVPLTIRGGDVVRSGAMIDRFAKGEYTRVPIVLGSNRDESKLSMMSDPAYTWRLLGLLPRVRDPERYARDAEYRSDAWKAEGVDEIAIEMRRHQGPTVFAYRFDWDEGPSVLGTDLAELVGAAHGIEIPFVMGVEHLGLSDEILVSRRNRSGREWLSQRMGRYWAEFARTGAPGRGTTGDLPAWSAWNDDGETSPRMLVLDTEADGGIRMSADYVTAARLAKRLQNDPRFDEGERCDAMARLQRSFPRLARAEAAACGPDQLASAP